MKISTINAIKKTEFSFETAEFQSQYIQALTILEKHISNIDIHVRRSPTPPVGAGTATFNPPLNIRLPDPELREFGVTSKNGPILGIHLSHIPSNHKLNPETKFNYLKSLISRNASKNGVGVHLFSHSEMVSFIHELIYWDHDQYSQRNDFTEEILHFFWTGKEMNYFKNVKKYEGNNKISFDKFLTLVISYEAYSNPLLVSS